MVRECACVKNLPSSVNGTARFINRHVAKYIYCFFSDGEYGSADALLDDDDDDDGASRILRKSKRLSSVISNAASMIVKSRSLRSWGLLRSSPTTAKIDDADDVNGNIFLFPWGMVLYGERL